MIKKILRWFLDHVAFEILKIILLYIWIAIGGGVIVIIASIWALMEESRLVIGYMGLGFGIIIVSLCIYLSRKTKAHRLLDLIEKIKVQGREKK